MGLILKRETNYQYDDARYYISRRQEIRQLEGHGGKSSFQLWAPEWSWAAMPQIGQITAMPLPRPALSPHLRPCCVTSPDYVTLCDPNDQCQCVTTWLRRAT